MSEVLRTLAYGELESGTWGLAWGFAEPFVALGSTAAWGTVSPPASRLEGERAADVWRLAADGAELQIDPLSDPTATARGDGEFEQLCQVTGTIARDGEELQVDCLGRRGIRLAPLDPERLDSVRDVSAWFPADEDPAGAELVGLVAVRPRKPSGHAEDAVSAVWIEAAGSHAVWDPRLSTTYDADGLPRAMTLELWLTEDDSEPYPRRVAGERLGVSADGIGGGLAVHAEILRCHCRGRDGLGVYLLGRPR